MVLRTPVPSAETSAMLGTPLVRLAVLLAVAMLLALGEAPPPASAQALLPLAGRTVVLDPGHNGGNGAHPEIADALVYAGNGIYKPCNTTGTGTDAGYREGISLYLQG